MAFDGKAPKTCADGDAVQDGATTLPDHTGANRTNRRLKDAMGRAVVASKSAETFKFTIQDIGNGEAERGDEHQGEK